MYVGVASSIDMTYVIGSVVLSCEVSDLRMKLSVEYYSLKASSDSVSISVTGGEYVLDVDSSWRELDSPGDAVLVFMTLCTSIMSVEDVFVATEVTLNVCCVVWEWVRVPVGEYLFVVGVSVKSLSATDSDVISTNAYSEKE